MTHHLNNDADRIAMVRRTRKYISAILYATLSMLAYTLYQLLY